VRSLLRNQQPVFFKLYEGEEEIIDEYGNATGSFYPVYSGLKSAMLCVSPNKGASEVQQFGSFEDYDRTMTTADANCPIDENAVLWVDGADTNGPWNYIVKLVARWKNSAQYAIKKVSVSTYKAELAKIEDAQKLLNEIHAREETIDAKNQAESQPLIDWTSGEGAGGLSEEG